MWWSATAPAARARRRASSTSGWDHELATEVMTTWIERRYISGTLMEVEELVQMVDTILRLGASASVPSVTVDAPPDALIGLGAVLG